MVSTHEHGSTCSSEHWHECPMIEAPCIVRPKRWLLIACVAALIVAPLLAATLPNPFEGLSYGERPSRILMFLWVAAVFMLVGALWRLATWTSYRADSTTFETRSWFGTRRFAWSTLQSASLDAPIGMPPAYELRFGGAKVRLIAVHFDPRAIQALRERAPKS